MKPCPALTVLNHISVIDCRSEGFAGLSKRSSVTEHSPDSNYVRRTLALLAIVSGLIFAAGQSFGQLPLTGAGKGAPSSTPGTVLVDATQFTTGVSNGDNVSFTVGAGPNGTANRAIVVAMLQSSGTVTATGVTYNGASLTAPVGFFYTLVAPATGAHNIVPSWTGGGTASIAVLSLVGVDQTGGATSFPGEVFASSTSTLAATTVSSATGQVVMGAFLSSTRVLSSSAVGTDIGNNIGAPDSNGDAANYGNGAASTTLSYNLSSDAWFSWGISVKAN